MSARDRSSYDRARWQRLHPDAIPRSGNSPLRQLFLIAAAARKKRRLQKRNNTPQRKAYQKLYRQTHKQQRNLAERARLARLASKRRAIKQHQAMLADYNVPALSENERLTQENILLRALLRWQRQIMRATLPPNIYKKWRKQTYNASYDRRDHDRKYRQTHHQQRNALSIKYYYKNRNKILAKNRAKTKQIRQDPIKHQQMKEYARNYYKQNADAARAAQRAYKRRRQIQDPTWRAAKRRQEKIRAKAKQKILADLGIPRSEWPAYSKALSIMLHEAERNLIQSQIDGG